MGDRNGDPAFCHQKHELLKVQLQYSILNGHQWLVSYYSCFNTNEKIHGINMVGTRMGPQVTMDVLDNRGSCCPASQTMCCHFCSSVLQTKCLTLNIPSLARQRCLSSWGPRRTPFFFFVISQLFDAVDYSNYVFWVSETIIQ